MPSGTFFRDSSGIRFPHKVNCAMSESMFNELKEIGLATDETLSTCIREALGYGLPYLKDYIRKSRQYAKEKEHDVRDN